MLFLCTVLAPHHLPPPGLAACSTDLCQVRVIVSEFYPCGLQDDEYIVLENIGVSDADLYNWTVTDLEGTLRFVSHVTIAPGERVVVSANSSSYLQAFACLPDAQMADDGCSLLSCSGTFRLADVGDSIVLRTPSDVPADFVKYGTCAEDGVGWTGPPVPALKKGEVAKRIGPPGASLDTDSAKDWMPFREHRYGFTAFSACRETVDAGDVTAFVSPDCGLSSVVTAIDGASRVIRLCSYEFSSDAVCTALAKALWRGVSVRILVDGAPAGGMSESQLVCLSFLQDSGADVRVLLGNLSQKTVQHVGPLHAKYLVLDDSGGVVLSENFVESGLPGDPYEGNRGWGVAFEDGRLAQYLACLFDEDSRSSRQDVRRWADDPRYAPGISMAWPECSASSCGIIVPLTTTAGSRVMIVPSPDCSLTEPFIAPMIAGADRFLVEQFQADLLWQDRWTNVESLSPLLAAVEEALEGGANGSVLLDSTWFNVEHNSEVAEHVNEYVASRGLLGEAKLMDSSGPSKTLHNKGLVLDGSIAIVSSNNWGVSSFAKNRELAVIIESTEIAGYFETAFRMDWEPDTEPPRAVIGDDISAQVGETVLLNGSRSSDDRGIARWTWALDGEGLLSADGPDARFCAAQPGTYLVRLSVRDAWGNMDSAVVSIEVLPSDGARSMLARVMPFIAASASAAAGAGLGALIARKLNHYNRGSR